MPPPRANNLPSSHLQYGPSRQQPTIQPPARWIPRANNLESRHIQDVALAQTTYDPATFNILPSQHQQLTTQSPPRYNLRYSHLQDVALAPTTNYPATLDRGPHAINMQSSHPQDGFLAPTIYNPATSKMWPLHEQLTINPPPICCPNNNRLGTSRHQDTT